MKVPPLGRLGRMLPAFLAGAGSGLLAGWLVFRGAAATRARRPGGISRLPPTPWRGRFEGAVDSFMGARDRLVKDEAGTVDLARLRRELASVPGAEGVRLRQLGGGIVEAVGAAPDAPAVERVLAALRGSPGVSVVVNRIWTPTSAEERPADLTHSPPPAPDHAEN